MNFGIKEESRFNLYLHMMMCIVILLGISFFVLAYEQERYEQELETRTVSIRLAEELRQSSNDLTRLARTYVTTGNPAFKEQFHSVVEIRDGKRPRPLNYSLAYWDFKPYRRAQEAHSAEPLGEAVPLLVLMCRAGVTEQELGYLEHSKEMSDELVQIESKAMGLIRANTPPMERLQAMQMLADERFLSMKAQAMQPIVETERMITERTQLAVETAHRRLSMATAAVFALGFLLVALIFKLRQQLHQIIGCSIPDLQKTITRLGSGDFLTPIKVGQDAADSVLSWISQTQRKLAALDLVHFKAIVDSSDDAIISKTPRGIVASWNRGAEKVFGYRAEEIIGKPMQTIIPMSRQHEEPEILERIANGEKVAHFETQRLHRDGHLVDVSVTISPMRDAEGRVIGASKIARDITRAKAAEAEIQRLAFYDTLSGLANRRLLQDRLQQALVRAAREKTQFAVLFLDLDNFKILNDTRGHEAGDALLREAAQRLTACVRESDTVARFGGDEFVVLLNSHQDHTLQAQDWLNTVAQKINASFSAPFQIADFRHTCTTSVGAAVYRGQACTAGDLLKQADHAMYQAKYAGKNGFQVFEH